jgi:type VI secretion system secreted protein VgrG
MGKFTQANWPMAVATPLGPDALLLEGFTGREAISRLFHFQLDLLAETATEVPFEKLLGQKITISLTLPDGKKNYFNGLVSRLSQGSKVRVGESKEIFIRYRAEMVPQFWLLTHNVQSRIFQQISVPDILKKVLAGLDVAYEIQGTFYPRDYCVQYRESDFAFASRLMEEEGIFYFFKHSADGHKMVVANTPPSHPDVPGATKVIYEEVVGGTRPDDRILGWEKSQEIRPGKYTLWDHCFELPHKHLEAEQAIVDKIQVGKINHPLKVGGNDKLEVYDYPGGYADRFDGVAPGGGERPADLQKIFEDNKRTVAIRMQQQALPSLVIQGNGTCRQFVSGHKFSLERHFNADGQYLLTEVEHRGNYEGAFLTPAGTFLYRSQFHCIPLTLPFRPQLVTPRPKVEGTQTAVVVGPPGEEIFTDKYGRVKVQFHWDRQGQNNADSSCWLRVGTPWAGKQWGMIHIPRIGQEVVVAFDEADPNKPRAISSVYNAEMMPPYKLPDHKTQSGIKTRSSLNGTADNFNELRFEDKKGVEEIYFHAEKDFNRVVENNDSLLVGKKGATDGDQTIEIWNNRSLKVGHQEAKDGSETIEIYKNRTETVKTGDETVTIEQGNRTVTVGKGNDTHEIKQGDRSVKIDMGNDSVQISMGNQTTKIDLGGSQTEAMQSIELKVGQSSIKLDQTGVTIQGMMVKIQGQLQTQVQGTMVQVQGDAMTQIQGGVTMIG